MGWTPAARKDYADAHNENANHAEDAYYQQKYGVTRAAVDKALQTLPEDQREVITLKLWGDLTFNEIAAMTGSSINTIAGRYRYALQALHKKLGHLRADLLGESNSPAINILPFSPTTEAMS